MVGTVTLAILSAITDRENVMEMLRFQEDGLKDFLLLLVIGVLGFVGQQMLTIAYKFETAAVATFLRKAFDTIVAFVLQIWIFSVRISPTSLDQIFIC